MGALCCCPCEFVDENEEYPLPTSTNPFYRVRFFFSGTGFQRLDGRSASSPIHAATTALTSSGITPTHTQQPYSRPQRDGLVSRRDKSITSLLQQRGFGKQREGADHKASSTEKALPTKVAYVQPSSQDEDVCPTCLDEYTPENPKITTRCSHHFHLGCIYEWLERSDSCPICGKEMEFCESP